MDINDESIVIGIQDEGDQEIMLPTKEEALQMNYLEEGGRGLKLAVTMCDAVRVHGNKLELVFDKNHAKK